MSWCYVSNKYRKISQIISGEKNVLRRAPLRVARNACRVSLIQHVRWALMMPVNDDAACGAMMMTTACLLLLLLLLLLLQCYRCNAMLCPPRLSDAAAPCLINTTMTSNDDTRRRHHLRSISVRRRCKQRYICTDCPLILIRYNVGTKNFLVRAAPYNKTHALDAGRRCAHSKDATTKWCNNTSKTNVIWLKVE